LLADPATRLIPVVLLTSLAAVEDRVRGIEAGADDFLTKPYVAVELEARVRSLTRLKRYTDELDSAASVILTLGLTIEARDPYTQGHCERLAGYATALGGHLFRRSAARPASRRLPARRRQVVGIPDAILLKPRPADPDEHSRCSNTRSSATPSAVNFGCSRTSA
jgi:putative two-component system response regulator